MKILKSNAAVGENKDLETEARTPLTPSRRLATLAVLFPKQVAANANTSPEVLDLLWWLYPDEVNQNSVLFILALEDPAKKWRAFTNSVIADIEEAANKGMTWSGFQGKYFEITGWWTWFYKKYNCCFVIKIENENDDIEFRIEEGWRNTKRSKHGSIKEEDIDRIKGDIQKYIAEENKTARCAGDEANAAVESARRLDFEAAQVHARNAREYAAEYEDPCLPNAYGDLCDNCNIEMIQHCAKERLKEIAKETDSVGSKTDSILLIAQDPRTPPGELAKLWEMRDRVSQDVLDAIAKNPNTPVDVLLEGLAFYQPADVAENSIWTLVSLDNPIFWKDLSNREKHGWEMVLHANKSLRNFFFGAVHRRYHGPWNDDTKKMLRSYDPPIGVVIYENGPVEVLRSFGYNYYADWKSFAMANLWPEFVDFDIFNRNVSKV